MAPIPPNQGLRNPCHSILLTSLGPEMLRVVEHKKAPQRDEVVKITH